MGCAPFSMLWEPQGCDTLGSFKLWSSQVAIPWWIWECAVGVLPGTDWVLQYSRLCTGWARCFLATLLAAVHLYSKLLRYQLMTQFETLSLANARHGP